MDDAPRWSGMRRVVVMASFALLATWGGTSAIYFLDDLGGVAGSPDTDGGLAAQDAQTPSILVPGLVPAVPEVAGVAGADPLLNATAPLPLPSLPPPPQP